MRNLQLVAQNDHCSAVFCLGIDKLALSPPDERRTVKTNA